MGDISLQITVKEENNHLFKRCIRKLLETTFILRDKDDKLYQFASRESNRQDISEYLRMIGFDVIVDDKTGVCMLIASEEDLDTVGLKRANVVSFTPLQYHLLLILWKIYLENLGYSEGNFVTKGDLIDKIKSYEIQLVRTELNAALRLFKKYSLINYSDEDGGEDMKIQLYPSLQFGWDLPQFQTVVSEYLKETQEGDDGLADAEEEPWPPLSGAVEKSGDPFGDHSSAADGRERVITRKTWSFTKADLDQSGKERDTEAIDFDAAALDADGFDTADSGAEGFDGTDFEAEDLDADDFEAENFDPEDYEEDDE